MNSIKKRGFPPNAIRLCIDEYNGELQGRIYSRMNEKPLFFENCGELLVRVDKLFDQCGYPQAFEDKKDFQGKRVLGQYLPPNLVMEDEEIYRSRGKIHTVDIFIRSRKNASWQGSILCGDGSPPERFDSEMELLECVIKSIVSDQKKEIILHQNSNSEIKEETIYGRER